MSSPAESLRLILSKIDEYIVLPKDSLSEEDSDAEKQDAGTDDEKTHTSGDDQSTDSTGDKDIDTVMTEPASAGKVIAGINPNILASMLSIPAQNQADFKSGLTTLAQDKPNLSTSQATAIAIGFSNLLSKGRAGLQKVSTLVHAPTTSVNEDYDKKFETDVSSKDLNTKLMSICKDGPNVQSCVRQLVKTLLAGSKSRPLSGGLQGIFNAIAHLVDIAESGDRKELLFMLDDFETKYEGDNHAFDQDLFPSLVLQMRKLGRTVVHGRERRESSSN